MRLTRALLSGCFLLAAYGVRADEGKTVVVERTANHYLLVNGESVDVIGSWSANSEDPSAKSGTYYFRSSAGVFTITVGGDLRWMIEEIRIAGTQTEISIRMDAGFGADGLAVPVSVRIDDRLARLLWSDRGTSPVALKRVRELVARAPSRFLDGLKAIYAVARFVDDSGLPASCFVIENFFVDPMPPLNIASTTPLKREEIEAIRSAAARR